MRLRNIAGSRETIAQSPFVVNEPREYRGNWKSLFGNERPVHVEIGMGKGQFLYTLAERNPQINYIGMEKYSSVLLRAVQKLEEKALPNLALIRMEAEEIGEVFGSGEVERIYLNFSDPWPKERHAKRRLPSRQFLERYDSILTKDGRLEFKTDNGELFRFAVEEAKAAGWKLRAVTYDLHRCPEMNADNVMTEYEEKFSAQGNPICKYVIDR